MENAKIAIFEDNPGMRDLITSLLTISGHKVVLEVDSFIKGVEAIKTTRPGSFDVAVVDADLGKDATEGDALIREIRLQLGDIAIIGISADEPPEDADTKISKFKIDEVINYIDSL